MQITEYMQGFFVKCDIEEKSDIMARIQNRYPVKKITIPQENENDGPDESLSIFKRNKLFSSQIKTVIKFCTKDKTMPVFAYPHIKNGTIRACDGKRMIILKSDYFLHLKNGQYSLASSDKALILTRIPESDQLQFPNAAKVLPTEGMCIVEDLPKGKEGNESQLSFCCTRLNPVNPEFVKHASEMPGPFNVYQTAIDKTVAITGTDYIIVIMPMIKRV